MWTICDITMAQLLNYRMPLTNCKRKLPSIFLGVCITLVAVFVLNLLQGLYRHDSLSDGEVDVVDGRRLAQMGLHRKNRKRMRLMEDEEDVVCKMPKLKILEKDRNLKQMHPLNCSGESLLYMDNSHQLVLNHSVLRGRQIKYCEYRGIQWQTDDSPMFVNSVIRRTDPFVVNMNQDFFLVECHLQRSFSRVPKRRKREIENKESDHGQNGVHHQKSFGGSIGLPDPVFVNGNIFKYNYCNSLKHTWKFIGYPKSK